MASFKATRRIARRRAQKRQEFLNKQLSATKRFAIKERHFTRLVHQIIRESGRHTSVEKDAVSIFQQLTESCIIDLLDCTAKMADHAGRVKITMEDMRCVMSIAGLGLGRLPKLK